jgi:transposase InsO family protein
MIGILKKHFARYGIPSIVMSDNGPQFVSREFERILSNWKVNHVTSSPGHQQSNGKAEAAVKIVKTDEENSQGLARSVRSVIRATEYSETRYRSKSCRDDVW